MEETALTVEEAMLLKIFHEYGIAECGVNRDLNFTDDEISLFKKIRKKADKHFYFISSRIRKEISLMDEFKTKMNSWDFSSMSSFCLFLDRRMFYTGAYVNKNKPSFEMIYFFFTEELFTVPSVKLIDGRVPIFESIQQSEESFLNGLVFNLKKRWKSIY